MSTIRPIQQPQLRATAAPSGAPRAPEEQVQDQVSFQGHHYAAVPKVPHIALADVSSSEMYDPKKLGAQMLSQMKAWEGMKAVVTVAPAADGNTEMLIASPPNAVGAPRYEGVYEVIQRLASSPSIKASAARFPCEFHTVRTLNAEGTLHETHLPGPQTAETVAAALAEGAQPNRSDLVKTMLDGLPKGRRVALLVTGPPGAGKSGLIDQVKKLAAEGGRNLVALEGDMYFKLDRNGLPKTAEGTPYWDHPSYMDLDRLKSDVAELITKGEADTPIFRFEDVKPPSDSGIDPGPPKKQPTKHVSLGKDDILVIDSFHAANAEVVSFLEKQGLDHATLFLDSPTPEVRMVRRMVRDYADRGGWLPQETMAVWDQTTWKGEVEFVRPTLLQMDPAFDTFMVTSFPKDVFLTRAGIDERIQEMDKYGLPPTYENFGAPSEQLPQLAKAQLAALEAKSELTDVEKKSLGRLQKAQGESA